MTDPKTLTDEQIELIGTQWFASISDGLGTEKTIRKIRDALATREQTASTGEPVAAFPIAWRWSAAHSEAPEDRAWKDGLPLTTAHESRIEVAYAPGSTPWRSMDSAPLDGTEVLLRVKLRAGIQGRCLVGHYMRGGHCIEDHPPIDSGWYFWNGCMFDKAAAPESWLPLPDAAPVEQAGSPPLVYPAQPAGNESGKQWPATDLGATDEDALAIARAAKEWPLFNKNPKD